MKKTIKTGLITLIVIVVVGACVPTFVLGALVIEKTIKVAMDWVGVYKPTVSTMEATPFPEPNEVIEREDVFCDACGESLTEWNYDGSRETWSGLSYSYWSVRDLPHKELRRLKATFGKTDFDICGVCFLKALGVKPIGG